MSKNILIAEDEEHIRTLIANRVKQLGYNILHASTGDEALKLIEEKPDLVILDIMMPVPDGLEVCRRIKRNPEYKSIPVMILTCKTLDSDYACAIESGANAFLTKPYDSEKLYQQIRLLLGC
ncbi:MAG: response regulator [Candidatus Omnitrophica bacterium]|nr:response regulator [Candidatus Omnitrophota bacterium]